MNKSLAVLSKHRWLYLATPYTKYADGIEAAWEESCRLAGRLLSQGLAVYSPIAHCHPIAVRGDLDPLDHSIWLPLNDLHLEAADALVVGMLPGWDKSYGIGVEIDFFNKAKKPIYYLHPVTMEVTLWVRPLKPTPLEEAIEDAKALEEAIFQGATYYGA